MASTTRNETTTRGIPTAERILSLLADLYADQMGVKVEYRVIDADGEEVKKGD